MLIDCLCYRYSGQQWLFISNYVLGELCVDFWTAWGSVPPTSMLFKSQLYRFPWNIWQQCSTLVKKNCKLELSWGTVPHLPELQMRDGTVPCCLGRAREPWSLPGAEGKGRGQGPVLLLCRCSDLSTPLLRIHPSSVPTTVTFMPSFRRISERHPKDRNTW